MKLLKDFYTQGAGFAQKALNLSYKRVRIDTAKKPDAAFYEKKKKELQVLEAKALENKIDVCYFDESGFNLTPNLPA